MKLIQLLVFSLLFTLCFSFSLYAESIDSRCTQDGVSACIDWDQGFVIAEGTGAPAKNATSIAQKNATAERAARLDAARNILEMVKGINLSSTTTMADAMLSSDTIRTQVQGKLYGLRNIGKPHYYSDGSVRLKVEASLRQTIPKELFQAPKEISAPQKISSGTTISKSSKLDVNRVYTGLVVDARGTGIKPAISPKIIDEDGKELYGSAYVDQEFVQKHGMAGYVKTIDQAKTNDRVSGKPAVVKALNSVGANNTDLLLANADALKLRKIAKNLNFLREARVVIVVD